MSLLNYIGYWFPLRDFLYILQLEEYNLLRYNHQVTQRIWKRGFEQRDTLQFTSRIKLTVVGVIICLAILALCLYSLHIPLVYALALVAISLPITTPYAIMLSSAVVAIPTNWQKKRRLQQARDYFIRNYPETKVIAITGSFGKTTTKYLLQHILQYDYAVAIIPDNLNTSLGIANYILSNKIPTNTQWLIVEMGAYTRGDIAESVNVVPPDIAILTILGDQHLERFGSRSDLIHGKCELFTTVSKTKCYVSTTSLEQITAEGITTDQLIAIDIPPGQKSTSYLVSKLAQDFGVSEMSIQASLDNFKPPDRRNNILVRNQVTIVDNSYNISPMVAEAMITEAASTAATQAKQLVVMTGGISEQGLESQIANQNLALLLNTYADRVIINPTIYADYIVTKLTVPYITVVDSTTVTNQPEEWLNGETELLLWLTGHGDLSYL